MKPFDINRGNQFISLNIPILKEFYSDSSETFRFGPYHKGLKGMEGENLNIILGKDNQLSIILKEQIFIKKHLVYFQGGYMPDMHHRSIYREDVPCIKFIKFSSIIDLENQIIKNSRITTGENLQHEVSFIMKKDVFINLCLKYDLSEFGVSWSKN